MDEPTMPVEDGDCLPPVPDHLIAMLRTAIYVPVGPDGPPPGTEEHTRIAWAQARLFAERIWAEGWTTGAAFGLARTVKPVTLHVTPDQFAEFSAHGVAALRTDPR